MYVYTCINMHVHVHVHLCVRIYMYVHLCKQVVRLAGTYEAVCVYLHIISVITL